MLDAFILGFAAYGFITSNSIVVLNSCQAEAKQELKALNWLSVASNSGIGFSAFLIGFFERFRI